MQKPYEGISTFLKTPIGDISKTVGVFGIPYDGSNSFRPGARFGPNFIRQASMMLTDGHHPLFEVDPALDTSDLGDISVPNVDVEKSLETIFRTISQHPMFLLDTARLMFMGGDHTVTTGIIHAYAQRYPDLAIIHFDAHCDTWESHFDSPIGHGTWVRNIVEWGWVKPENIVQIGLRSPVDPKTRDWLPDKGGLYFNSRTIMNYGINPIRDIMSRIQHIANKPIYISLDIDVLDPSFAPGTGTPEIGGLSPTFMLDFLELLVGGNTQSSITIPKPFNIIGMDVVEVNPSVDVANITSLAAATFLWTVASGWLRKNTVTPSITKATTPMTTGLSSKIMPDDILNRLRGRGSKG